MIVVTDRRILDQQLQNTIYQFDHKQGVVQKMDEDTRQLVQALANGTPIIITTLQKFPFISETLEKLREEDHPGIAISTKDKQFAVIVDEAHSSQSGESAMELKGVLNADRLQEEAAEYAAEHELDEDDDEDADHLAGVVREMMRRGKQPNLSFFAFTATPKYKTKKVFDEPGPIGRVALPPLHDAAGHRGEVHPRRAEKLHRPTRPISASCRRREDDHPCASARRRRGRWRAS